ncbi:hypothetical protein Tco_0379600 [Tanacetum coccineum]
MDPDPCVTYGPLYYCVTPLSTSYYEPHTHHLSRPVRIILDPQSPQQPASTTCLAMCHFSYNGTLMNTTNKWRHRHLATMRTEIHSLCALPVPRPLRHTTPLLSHASGVAVICTHTPINVRHSALAGRMRTWISSGATHV